MESDNKPEEKKIKICEPKQIAKKAKVESKSDQKSIDQSNRKSTNKLQDVKFIVCTNEIKLLITVHEDETWKLQCEPVECCHHANFVRKVLKQIL